MFLFRKFSGRSGLSATHQDDSNICSHDDKDFAKQALDQASEYVSEGDYEEALWILERLGQVEPAVKGVAELAAVAEVCNAAILRTCACPRENRNPDWYKVLKVDEKSELGAIKKRYRHLALLLHPDKNKHVKAEAAFKLVLEAYACLSDKKKREIFNVKKSLTKCKHCSLSDCAASGSDRWSSYNVLRGKTSLQRTGSSPDLTQADWILDQERLRMFRAKARARVLGNLEKAWKERGFTGLEKTTLIREQFYKNRKGEGRMNTNLYGCKIRTSDTTQEKEETRTDCFSVVGDKDLGMEENKIDAVEHNKAKHQQLFQPSKNLGALIRDLQAELISSTECKECQKDEQDDAVSQKSSPAKDPRPDARSSEALVQDGRGKSNAMSGAYTQGNSMEYSPGTSKAASWNQAASAGQKTCRRVGNHSLPSSADGCMCPDGFLDNDSPVLKNELPWPNDVVSKQRFDEGVIRDNRKEHDLKSEEPRTVTMMEMQENRGRRPDEQCAGTVLRKHILCRQTRRDDSLDLEETILQIQREKSEQLLKTLQRLREETKTVAASLNHLCSGCS